MFKNILILSILGLGIIYCKTEDFKNTLDTNKPNQTVNNWDINKVLNLNLDRPEEIFKLLKSYNYQKNNFINFTEAHNTSNIKNNIITIQVENYNNSFVPITDKDKLWESLHCEELHIKGYNNAKLTIKTNCKNQTGNPYPVNDPRKWKIFVKEYDNFYDFSKNSTKEENIFLWLFIKNHINNTDGLNHKKFLTMFNLNKDVETLHFHFR